MRKHVIRQILELLPTIANGICYAQKAEKQNAATVLADCCTAIHSITKALQKGLSQERFLEYEKNITRSIKTIEEMKILLAKEESTVSLVKGIQYNLQAVKVKLNREKEVKIEVLFLPYKASMWDSLESIWRAAADDPQCDAYVVPIPYCDRNPDGTAAEWHCEAELFPQYVPVLDWNEYTNEKLKEMHPDVIFIHNPYDDHNAVTSVDMQYYSRDLKYCTDKLIYIPYYVSGTITAPHFCQTPAVENADYVIVQDEKNKRQFERYYPGGKIPEGKFLAFGSPKFDKVINSRRTDFILPEKWRKLIGGKKVVLYNTSLAAALYDTDSVCDKLKYVFDMFQKRKDVVLWWRPHPLMKATLRSMRPDVLMEYLRIEKKYIQANWGIYDNTPDLARAIVCTDAYYGDMSSVVWLYRATGKRIIYQDMNYIVPKNYIDIAIWASAFCGNERFIWFIHGAANLLFCYDISVGSLECLGSVPGNQMTEEGLFSNMIFANEKLFLIPFKADKITVFDIKTRQFKNLGIPYGDDSEGMLKFSQSILYGKWIYCVPCEYSHFIKINTMNNIIEEISELQDNKFNINTATLVDNKIVGVFSSTNVVFIYSLDDGKITIKEIGDKSHCYSTIASDKDYIYFGSYGIDRKVYVFDKENLCNEIKTYRTNMNAVRDFDENHVLLDDVTSGEWCILENNKNVIMRKNDKMRQKESLQYSYHSMICKRYKDILYAFDCHTNELYKFDMLQPQVMKLHGQDALHLPNKSDLLKGQITKEFAGLNVDDILSDVDFSESKYDGMAGRRIYSYCRRQVK